MGTSELLKAPKEFLKLYKAGKDAAQRGEKAKAHDLLRRAIEIDPYHEQVWLWLASVVDTDEDRRVCFENALRLNPQNAKAKTQLDRLEQKALEMTLYPQVLHRYDAPSRRRKTARVVILLLLLVAVIAAAAIVVFF